jgi:hypothetical protein
MAQLPFNPTTGVSTHQDALTVWNGNAADAELRLSDLEAVSGDHLSFSSDITDLSNDITDLQTKTIQQSISSSSSILTLDVSLGGNATTTLTEDVTGFFITNAATGDSGFILVEQDTTAAWTFSSSYDVLAGNLADIASITPSGSGAASIGWYNDGTDKYLFVSDFT